jgi:folate-binding protein YgfZ
MPLAHLSDRAVVKMSGDDSLAFLQGQITNDVGLLGPGRPLYAGVLSPQGKTLWAIFLHAGDDGAIRIDCPAEGAEALALHFTRYRLRRRFQVEPEPALAVYQQWGEAGAGPADPRLEAAGTRFLAPAPGHAGAPAPTAGIAQWHAHRLPLGLGEADEIGHDRLLWPETNAAELHGTSFTKGCYTGQENVARMHHRDKLRRRLLPLWLDAPAHGPVVAGGTRDAGELVGRFHAAGPSGGMQMARMRLDAIDQPLTIDGRPARLVAPPWLAAGPDG